MVAVIGVVTAFFIAYENSQWMPHGTVRRNCWVQCLDCTTMNLYTQAVPAHLRDANSSLVRLVLNWVA